MNLAVKRIFFTDASTCGALYIEDVFQCYTLELPGDKAIPTGTYSVTIDMSTRFKRLMPHVLDVPGRTGIRIHWGNTAADTEGCILVGQTQTQDFIGGSRQAFEALYEKLAEALLVKKALTLTVIDTRKP